WNRIRCGFPRDRRRRMDAPPNFFTCGRLRRVDGRCAVLCDAARSGPRNRGIENTQAERGAPTQCCYPHDLWHGTLWRGHPPGRVSATVAMTDSATDRIARLIGRATLTILKSTEDPAPERLFWVWLAPRFTADERAEIEAVLSHPRPTFLAVERVAGVIGYAI